MPFVIDASIAAAWFLPDERNDPADAIMVYLDQDIGLVPSLFWFETRNLFLMAKRRGRMEPVEPEAPMAGLRRFPISEDTAGDDTGILALARRRSLSGYDASYLSVAVRHAVHIATADRKMAQAAKSEGISVMGPFADG